METIRSKLPAKELAFVFLLEGSRYKKELVIDQLPHLD